MYFLATRVLIQAFSSLCVLSGFALVRRWSLFCNDGATACHKGSKRRDKAAEQGEHMQKKKMKGVTIVEYAIMLALVAVAIAVSVPSITSAVNGVFSKTSSVMK